MKRNSAFTVLLFILSLLFTGCATGPVTPNDRMRHMHACKRAGGVWITSADTPEWYGRCDWTRLA
jgi:hypothetical protein